MNNEAEISKAFKKFFKKLTPTSLSFKSFEELLSNLENLPIYAQIKEKDLLPRIREYISDDYFYYRNLKTRVGKMDLFNRALMEHKDLFHCIINGYYSFDLLSYTRNLNYFFDLICDFVDGAEELARLETIDKSLYYEEDDDAIYSFEYNITDFVFQFVHNSYPIKIEENKLVLHKKEYEGFALNIKLVEEENAFEYQWFQNHLLAYTNLIKALKGSDLMNKRFLDLLDIINTFSEKQQNILFSDVVNEIQGTETLKNCFADLLNSLTVPVFIKLMDSIKGTKLFKTHYSLIERKFTTLLDSLHSLKNSDHFDSFSTLMKSIKETKLIKRQHNFIDTHLNSLLDCLRGEEVDLYKTLLKAIINTEFMMDKFSILVEIIEVLKYPFYYTDSTLLQKINAFLILLELIKDTKVLDKNLSLIGDKFSEFLDTVLREEKSRAQTKGFEKLVYGIRGTLLIHEKYLYLLDCLRKEPNLSVFMTLLEVNEGTEVVKKDFPIFFKILDKLSYQYNAFSSLISQIVNTEIMKDYYSQIQRKFLELLEGIEKIDNYSKLRTLRTLLEPLSGTSMINDNFIAILSIVQTLDSRELYHFFPELLGILDMVIVKENLIDVLHSIEMNQNLGFSFLMDALELNGMLEDCFSVLLKEIKDSEQFNTFISKICKTELIKTQYSLIEKKVYEAFNASIKNSRGFNRLIITIKGTDLAQKNFAYICNLIDKLREKFTALGYLADWLKGSTLSEENIALFLSKFRFPSSSNDHMMYYAFSKLIIRLHEENILEKFSPEINTIFINLINELNTFRQQKVVNAFQELVSGLQQTNLLKDYFRNLLDAIKSFSKPTKYHAFKTLILMNKENEWMREEVAYINGKFPDYSYELKVMLRNLLNK
jgi:hypothetical protein